MMGDVVVGKNSSVGLEPDEEELPDRPPETPALDDSSAADVSCRAARTIA